MPVEPFEVILDTWSPTRERNDVVDFLASLEDIFEHQTEFDDRFEGFDLDCDVSRPDQNKRK